MTTRGGGPTSVSSTRLESHRNPQLPQCQAKGCTNLVHYDPDLPEGLSTTFSYCSPRCRDTNLLPTNRAALTKDLKELKEELQKVVATEKSLKLKQQSSSSSIVAPGESLHWVVSLLIVI